MIHMNGNEKLKNENSPASGHLLNHSFALLASYAVIDHLLKRWGLKQIGLGCESVSYGHQDHI